MLDTSTYTRKWTRMAIAAVAATSVALTGTTALTGTRLAAAESARPEVIVQDVRIPVPGQEAVKAWLVRPAKAPDRSAAGILWLHWLGQIHSDRSEFLAEAVDLAAEGTVSLLPQGTFPWVGDPIGTDQDVAAVQSQLNAFRASLRWLKSRRFLAHHRLAIVGHDYGAMYGTLLADGDADVTALALAAPDATWGNWFATFWLGLEGSARTAYSALFDRLDPVDHAGRLGSHVLLQWAGDDFFIPAEVRDAYAAAAPDAQVKLYPGVDHQFTTRAQIDRDEFLRRELGLG